MPKKKPLDLTDIAIASLPVIGGALAAPLGPAAMAVGSGAGQLVSTTIDAFRDQAELEKDLEEEEKLRRKEDAVSLLSSFL